MDLVKIESIVSAFNSLKTISIRLFSGNNIKIEQHSHTHNGPVINLQNLDEKTKGELKSLIKTAFLENKAEVLRLETEKPLKLLGSGSDRYSNILVFYKDKLNAEHYSILRVAVAVRYAHDEGDKTNVNVMKRQAMLSYGEKAANVCNLCTAGYFESFLMPLYDSYSKKYSGPDLANTYLKAYMDIVDNEPFTIFVGRGMTVTEIETEVMEKLETFKKYGASKLYVHGIGNENIQSIKDTFSSMKDYLAELGYKAEESSMPNTIRIEVYKLDSQITKCVDTKST